MRGRFACDIYRRLMHEQGPPAAITYDAAASYMVAMIADFACAADRRCCAGRRRRAAAADNAKFPRRIARARRPICGAEATPSPTAATHRFVGQPRRSKVRRVGARCENGPDAAGGRRRQPRSQQAAEATMLVHAARCRAHGLDDLKG